MKTWFFLLNCAKRPSKLVIEGGSDCSDSFLDPPPPSCAGSMERLQGGNAGFGDTEEDAEERHRALAYDTVLSTLVAVLVYVVLKGSLDVVRQWRARISVLIVGSGPVGLTAALVAVRSGKVLKLTVLDERYRTALLCRPQQIALDPRSVKFLLGLGVDFDNMEGCWHNEHFFTRIGVFQEYLLSILEQMKQKVDVRVQLGTKVSLVLTPSCNCFALYAQLSSRNVHAFDILQSDNEWT